jgi:C4-type Zn-finger protein
MESETQKMLNRLAEEERNKQRSDTIICPYCYCKQDTETTYQHVSYWGEDSLERINCEHCGKDFYVEERVERTFETTTVEWMRQLNSTEGLNSSQP